MRKLLLLSAALLSVGAARAETVVAARYAEPTERYDHGVLGDAIEWGALEIETDEALRVIRLDQDRVFEDVAPRLADLDGDGGPEVLVVESSLTAGARLAVYDEAGLVAATDFIGQPHRWLAPLGAADLDGDGRVEAAYVDRPHLARVLRVVRLEGDRLVPVAELSGVTNHRIGEATIGGGIRDCGSGPEIVAASGDWSRLLAVALEGGRLAARDLGPFEGFGAALACEVR